MTAPVTVIDPLDYYAAHKCALFPIPAGSKSPTGIVASFKADHSADPAQWRLWRADHPNCNFGVVAFASRLIIADVDTKELGRDGAWALWCQVCADWGIPVAMPHVQSARGGWHILFSIPADIDPATLRQPDAVKKHINLRCIGYTVAAGSTFNDPDTGQALPYSLLTDAAPYPAPPALIEHCTRRPAPARSSTVAPGSLDPKGVAELVAWLTAKGEFGDYESWFQIGMAIKIELGDAGFPIWELTFDETVTPDTAATKWESFATEPDAHSVTLLSFMQRAHRSGWKGNIGRTAQDMFGSVVSQMAAAAGASLPGAIPMDGGQAELTRQATPVLTEFLAATIDAPTLPAISDLPALPPQMSGHGLYALLNETIVRVFALAESPKFKGSRCTAALAELYVAHKDVYDTVARRVEAMGRTLQVSKIKLAAAAREDSVQRCFVKQDAWVTDNKGLPESDNPDNVVVGLGVIGADVRWNAWLNRCEIQGHEWPQWVAIDDVVIAKLKQRFLRTGTRFRVGNEFLRESLLAIAHGNQFDPVVERIKSLVWDRTPRLVTWLSYTTGVPCDPYHQAVGKNVIGGMVKRARTPGAKHDEVMILIGKQGTAKSTLCRTLAMDDSWFTDSVAFDGSPQNIVPQLFGKLVVELAELDGMAKKEVQHIKAFITRQSDNVTLKYKAFAADFSRRCIFIGTSNEDSPLVDITGNRRFLPVRVVGEINVAWLRENVEQLVAEAAHLLDNGADFSIPRDVWAMAAEHQEAARSVSDVEARLTDWFAITPHTETAFISKGDLIDLSDIAGWRGVHALRASVMKRLGFREVLPYIAGARTWVWLRGPEMLPRHVENVTRYLVSKSQDGRPRVTIRHHAIGASPTAHALGLPMPPAPSRT